MADFARGDTAASCHKKQKPRRSGALRVAMPPCGSISRRLRLAFYFFQTVERCFVAQRFFDTNQLVVLSNTVRTAH